MKSILYVESNCLKCIYGGIYFNNIRLRAGRIVDLGELPENYKRSIADIETFSFIDDELVIMVGSPLDIIECDEDHTMNGIEVDCLLIERGTFYSFIYIVEGDISVCHTVYRLPENVGEISEEWAASEECDEPPREELGGTAERYLNEVLGKGSSFSRLDEERVESLFRDSLPKALPRRGVAGGVINNVFTENVEREEINTQLPRGVINNVFTDNVPQFIPPQRAITQKERTNAQQERVITQEERIITQQERVDVESLPPQIIDRKQTVKEQPKRMRVPPSFERLPIPHLEETGVILRGDNIEIVGESTIDLDGKEVPRVETHPSNYSISHSDGIITVKRGEIERKLEGEIYSHTKVADDIIVVSAKEGNLNIYYLNDRVEYFNYKYEGEMRKLQLAAEDDTLYILGRLDGSIQLSSKLRVTDWFLLKLVDDVCINSYLLQLSSPSISLGNHLRISSTHLIYNSIRQIDVFTLKESFERSTLIRARYFTPLACDNIRERVYLLGYDANGLVFYNGQWKTIGMADDLRLRDVCKMKWNGEDFLVALSTEGITIENERYIGVITFKLTLDGVVHSIAQFSSETKSAILIHNEVYIDDCDRLEWKNGPLSLKGGRVNGVEVVDFASDGERMAYAKKNELIVDNEVFPASVEEIMMNTERVIGRKRDGELIEVKEGKIDTLGIVLPECRVGRFNRLLMCDYLIVSNGKEILVM